MADHPEEADGQDEELGGSMGMGGAARVWCPYCGEGVELILDPGGGPTQEYVEDCEVCCRPWQVRVRFEHDGTPSVSLTTLDEG